MLLSTYRNRNVGRITAKVGAEIEEIMSSGFDRSSKEHFVKKKLNYYKKKASKIAALTKMGCMYSVTAK